MPNDNYNNTYLPGTMVPPKTDCSVSAAATICNISTTTAYKVSSDIPNC